MASTKEQKLKHSVYFTSRKMSREVGAHLNLEFDSDVLDLIAELTWKKLILYASDLEAFQKHAKRSTVTSDDVKLLVRRNDSLKELMASKLQAFNDIKGSSESTSKNKRKASNS
ncbi:centromere protein S-like isoform X1 [Tribolium madens]|uniref:centromere protein S-like isoform X1 n=2 Tax=Tribolium madens TaxID=41895 RepID=UPI001CF72251|nr:centromere protein S-like isoform X1 [Tribolium madens]